MVICLERGADLHMAQLKPLPLTVSCFSKIQFGFVFLVPAHPGSPGKRPLNVCVLPFLIDGVFVWLSVWSEVQILHMVQLPSKNRIISCLFEFRLVLPFWYRLTQVVLERRGRSKGCSSSFTISY